MKKKLKTATLFLLCILLTIGTSTAYAEEGEINTIRTDDGDVAVSIYDLDPTLTPPEYPAGTYKTVKSDSKEGIKGYKQPDYSSMVVMELPQRIYFNLRRFENGFGYITYQEKDMWIPMENVQILNIMYEDSFLITMNEAAHALIDCADCDKEVIYEYGYITQLLDTLDTLDDKSQIESITEQLPRNTEILLQADAFIKKESPILPEGYRLVGDVYLDNDVNMRDIVTLQKYIAKLINLDFNSHVAGDADGNDFLNMMDAVLCQQFLASFFDNLPAGLIFHISI